MRIYGKRLLLVLLLVQWTAILFMGFLGVSQAWADDNAAVKKGDRVSLQYTGTFADGSVFDTSKKRDEPLKFTAGKGQVIPGFDRAVMGMKMGEEKKFTLQPEEAYGDRKPDWTQTVPRKKLPKNHEPKKGMILVLGKPDGRQVPATITEVTADNVILDLNHPLAGKVLTFDIKIVEISN